MNALRGLNIRADYAKRKLMQKHFSAQAAELWVSLEDAYALGVNDYYRGCETPPPLFKDESLLLDAWEEGQSFAEESFEMANCSSCQNREGFPCPFHG